MDYQTEKEQPSVKVEKEFNASPQQIFDAWLDPEMLSRWMFGSDVRDEEIVNLRTDAEEKGTFSFVLHRDGEKLDHRGTYRVVNRPNKLVFTWGVNEEAGDASVVTISITPTATGCRLTLVHTMDPKWAEYVDRTREGWSFMLDKLKAVAA